VQHVDEGTLHAYLDGELSPAEVAEFERHLSVCVPCRAQLAEARAFVSEADEMIVALDVVKPSAAPRNLPRPARTWRPKLTTLAWTASLVLAVGVGYRIRSPEPVASVVTDGVAAGQDLEPKDAQVSETAPQPAAPTPRSFNRAAPRIDQGQVAKAAQPVRDEAVGLAAAGAGSTAAQGETRANDAIAMQERAGPPAPAAEAPAPTVTPPSRVALVDGAPVDTSVRNLTPGFGFIATTAPKRITLDEAVTHLGGTIRLIDGLAPQRVELLAGVDVPGADPDRAVIRVYYEEPDLGLVTLDQQRPGPSFASSDARQRRAESEPAEINVNPPMTSTAGRLVARAPIATSTIAWRADGVWLALTSHRAGVKMNELQARVK
jgi:anti-sigma factor RsiW